MPRASSSFAMFVLSAVFLTATPSHAAPCLSYEPSVVKIAGTLVRRTFAGPPNYESVRHGDAPETYWLVQLSEPACIIGDSTERDLNQAHANIREIQLVVDKDVYQSKKRLVGQKVLATGTLFGAISGHHHTPVLLTLRSLSRSSQ